MKFFDFKEDSLPSIKRVGRVFPVGKLTLLAGLPGSGKTESTIRELNRDSIEPIWINLDGSTIKNGLKAHMFYERAFEALLLNQKAFEDLNDQVLIIDTYTRAVPIIERVLDIYDKKEIVDIFESLCSYYNLTLIVIGHTHEYVGKDSIFKDNEILVRNCFEYIYLDRQIKQTTCKKTKRVQHTEVRIAYINKARMYQGERFIDDFGSPDKQYTIQLDKDKVIEYEKQRRSNEK